MRLRNLALAITAAGLLAVGAAAPSPAAEIKKFEGTIALPAPAVSNMMAGTYLTDAAAMVCPDAGEGDGVFYKFFDLGADFKHFYVSGPPTTLDEPYPADPSGLGAIPSGNRQDYDLDMYAYTAKCVEVDIEGPIMTASGIGAGTAARPVRYVAVNYYDGIHLDIPITLEASNDRIKK